MPRGLRLPAVPSLASLLPKGTEGGKEFARIVDLLLLHDSKISGNGFSTFNDAAGDYAGLDSFGSNPSRRNELVGYQYKFFASPLTNAHRSEVIASLNGALGKIDQSKITKWILVTPDDLTNSATRRDGGDVTWFQKLIEDHASTIEIEHIGHTKLIHLFLQAELICLYYYPELVSSGASRRKCIAEVRSLYDANLTQKFGRVEFVGMSVYKEEATRGVPLEQIYIPLSTVDEGADDSDDAARLNPLDFLRTGKRTIILGDPGSGKSTLLSFLALSGISPELQGRYGASPDSRLPLIVTLRRYADEIKTRRQLSLIDYIIELIQADFSLKAADHQFLHFYLETGQTILLFDGLDELPNSQFKHLIRDRINALGTTFPGNTFIVTSRIVGYEAKLRFSAKDYEHCRLAGLRLPEIERFIGDWYSARITNAIERRANVSDLIRIVSQPENHSIRDLASNPLLLTIIALVHRIDAVLPDERVVLYQKCSETLLNTWHKWKYREEDERGKTRIERRNRNRLEAIAFWMQCRSATEAGRAVAPGNELQTFLRNYIMENEQLQAGEIAEDLVDEFLEFVRFKTGLLIEVGDNQFSFVHLTFQEYLTATALITRGEKDGVTFIWKQIQNDIESPRWREVIRLLIASLKSNESQSFFLDSILRLGRNTSNLVSRAALVVGLIADGIEPAEEKAPEIIKFAFDASLHSDSQADLRLLSDLTKTCLARDATLASRVSDRLDPQKTGAANALRFSLSAKIMGITLKDKPRRRRSDEFGLTAFESLINDGTKPAKKKIIHCDRLEALRRRWTTATAPSNLMSAAGQAFVLQMFPADAGRTLFEAQLTTYAPSYSGPFHDHFMNTISVAFGSIKRKPDCIISCLREYKDTDEPDAGGSEQHFAKIRPIIDSIADLLRRTHSAGGHRRNLDFVRTDASSVSISRMRNTFLASFEDAPRSFWSAFRSNDALVSSLLSSAVDALELTPKAHWNEALRQSFLERIPGLLAKYFESELWDRLTSVSERTEISPQDSDLISWLLLLDGWLWTNRAFRKPEDSEMYRLASNTRLMKSTCIQIAHCMRDLCYDDSSSEIRLRSLVDNDHECRELLVRCGWALADESRRSRAREKRNVNARLRKKLKL